MTTNVMACIDGSSHAGAVCDFASWASLRLDAPLTFIHVLDKTRQPGLADLSGTIGLGTQEHLLEELASLDEKRSRLAKEQGRQMLDAALARAIKDGVNEPSSLQRHGELVETLVEFEPRIRLLVLGRYGEDSGSPFAHLGSHVEQVIRAVHSQVLITLGEFKAPQHIMLAFDGSATTRKAVEILAQSPLFKGLTCHLVLVGADTDDHREQLNWAKTTLEAAGIDAPATIIAGEVEKVLGQYQQDNHIDMMVVGAYGHSRIRQWLVGSTTTTMISTARVPLLILR
ncbi:nucleotide-binding universal stress UspA family protein [Oceanisphaera litoralis]|uniref:universal stress protein n=1 Tax=Oceanisphaera litoralis TaxID=225144 RepID=UPI00195F12C0|nr:universal stress protein [Oceanisphaera litoralis]MBM7455894.1 nucleotide-binding universal stress UspA family protein [Oceanisphaera litoralis]